MKFYLLFLLLIIIIISTINSGLTEEQKKYLLKKVTKLVSFTSKTEPLNQYFERGNQTEMVYEASKIKEILDNYSFPESYNYITEKSPNVYIKDQGNCGSCWAFASTTALAYRFHNKGIYINLSPQHSISCYINDCDEGDYLIDSQFNLVKNGTVTEECLPYSSGIGINTESCPAKCKNGDDLKFYYAKNAYTTEDDYSRENFYDIITVIIDQLITYGPVESGFTVYSDFNYLNYDFYCKAIIYSKAKSAVKVGGHAAVIVGYGVEYNRYYWILQNSWGKNFCDGGFFRVEFGQINIERVSFTEAFVDDNSEGKKINIHIDEITNDCKIKFSTNVDMNGSFEMYYVHDKDEFYFQCGLIYLGAKEGICSFNVNSIKKAKGTFIYREHQTLLNKDIYNLNFASSTSEFYFYGADFIDSYYNIGNNYYVSEEVNSLTLIYKDIYTETETFLSNIYPSINSTTALSNCSLIKLDNNFSIIYCTLTIDEIENLPESNNSPLSYDILCGSRESMLATLNKFNSGNYPIFRIKKFTSPKDKKVTSDSIFEVSADVEGSLSGFTNEVFSFGVFVRIEIGEHDYYELLICYYYSPTNLERGYLIPCFLDIDERYSYSYDNIYLTSYIVPVKDSNPFQVVVEIKDSKDNGFSIGLILAIVIPCILIIIFLVVLAIVYSKKKSSTTKQHLPINSNGFSNSEINRYANSSQFNRRIQGGNI